MPPYTRSQRALAVLYGFACHATFVAAIAAMMAGLHEGLASGQGPFEGRSAYVANAFLALQFPILHSTLLTERGRRWLLQLAPRGLAAALSPTTFALVASVQILVTFTCWSPSGIVWWSPAGPARAAMTVAYGVAWVGLLKAMADAGLPLQTGFAGWNAVARGRAPCFGTFPTTGMFAYVRQPIYVAFALTLWTGACWTPDRLALALVWTLYCVAGPLLKERRYLRRYGAAFESYRRAVPYWVPKLRKDLAR